MTKKPAYPTKVLDKVGCDRFGGRLVTGIDPAAPSPDWMQRRLTHAGMRPISLIVDITNYVMLELGQPMHAFDAARLSGPLVVRRAKEGEQLTTLDGVQRVLDPEDMVIADDTGVISLAAVMGGASTEVSDATTDVLFEAAHWDPVAIARSSRRHKLLHRGEPPVRARRRHRDRAGRRGAGDRAVGPSTAAAPPIRRCSTSTTSWLAEPIRIPVTGPSTVAGVNYPAKRVTALLTEIGATVTPAGTGLLDVTPPTWRPDLTDPADLAEEVIRLDGYDKVPSELPIAPPGNGLTPQQRRRRSVGRALAEAGYVEVLNYPFVAPGIADALGLSADDPRRHAPRLANPLSAEEPMMRTTLLPPLLATLRRNVGRGQRDVALFELGLVFLAGDDGVPPAMPVDHRPSEKQFAAAAGHPAGSAVACRRGPRRRHRAGRLVGCRTVQLAGPMPCRRGGSSARSRASRRPSGGRTGAVAPRPLRRDRRRRSRRGLRRRAASCGVRRRSNCPGAPAPWSSTWTAYRSRASRPHRRSRHSRPRSSTSRSSSTPPVPATAVQDALVAGAGDLLEAVRLFDVFTGEQVGAGRKSLAYKLTFRAPDRTLTAEEAVAARDAAVAVAAQRHHATLRGA